MRGLYKYPQNEYPYEKLLTENRNRSKTEPEYELSDTGDICLPRNLLKKISRNFRRKQILGRSS